VYRTVAELRAAVDAFVNLCNEQWLPEQKGFLSPAAKREAWYARQVAAKGRSVSKAPGAVQL